MHLENEIASAIDSLTRWEGVKRIWLFGSGVHGKMDWRSDLDFAVEGLCRTDYARAWSFLDTAVSLPVDLVCIERASPILKNEILTRGRKIYEA